MEKLKRVVPTLIFFILLLSCTTTYRPDISISEIDDTNPKKTVYIKNPELEYEFEIFKSSNIYDISQNPETRIHVLLLPFERVSRPAELTFLLPILTFGILPEQWGTGIVYKFNIEEGEEIISKKYVLTGLYEKSIWGNFRKDYTENERTYGLMLRAKFNENEN